MKMRYLGVVVRLVADFEKELPQMVHLIEAIVISVRVAEEVEQPQEGQVDQEFLDDRPHAELFQALITGVGDFVAGQPIDRSAATVRLRRTASYPSTPCRTRLPAWNTGIYRPCGCLR